MGRRAEADVDEKISTQLVSLGDGQLRKKMKVKSD